MTKNRRPAATIQRMLRILLEWFTLSQFPIKVRADREEVLPRPLSSAYEAILFSAERSSDMTGMIKIPHKKLLTPWIKSHGSPAMIHATIPLKFSPNKIACAGAYNVPNRNPCAAHTVI